MHMIMSQALTGKGWVRGYNNTCGSIIIINMHCYCALRVSGRKGLISRSNMANMRFVGINPGNLHSTMINILLRNNRDSGQVGAAKKVPYMADSGTVYMYMYMQYAHNIIKDTPAKIELWVFIVRNDIIRHQTSIASTLYMYVSIIRSKV